MAGDETKVKLIDRLKELDAKATPGPCLVRKSLLSEGYEVHGSHQQNISWCIGEADAFLHAQMRNALPKLLAFIDAYDDWEENGGFYAQPGEKLSRARSALDEEGKG